MGPKHNLANQEAQEASIAVSGFVPAAEYQFVATAVL
jgi:hypothetical protein